MNNNHTIRNPLHSSLQFIQPSELNYQNYKQKLDALLRSCNKTLTGGKKKLSSDSIQKPLKSSGRNRGSQSLEKSKSKIQKNFSYNVNHSFVEPIKSQSQKEFKKLKLENRESNNNNFNIFSNTTKHQVNNNANQTKSKKLLTILEQLIRSDSTEKSQQQQQLRQKQNSSKINSKQKSKKKCKQLLLQVQEININSNKSESNEGQQLLLFPNSGQQPCSQQQQQQQKVHIKSSIGSEPGSSSRKYLNSQDKLSQKGEENYQSYKSQENQGIMMQAFSSQYDFQDDSSDRLRYNYHSNSQSSLQKFNLGGEQNDESEKKIQDIVKKFQLRDAMLRQNLANYKKELEDRDQQVDGLQSQLTKVMMESSHQINSLTKLLEDEQKKNSQLKNKLQQEQKNCQTSSSQDSQIRSNANNNSNSTLVNMINDLKKEKAHLEEVLKNFLLERELEKIRDNECTVSFSDSVHISNYDNIQNHDINNIQHQLQCVQIKNGQYLSDLQANNKCSESQIQNQKIVKELVKDKQGLHDKYNNNKQEQQEINKQSQKTISLEEKENYQQGNVKIGNQNQNQSHPFQKPQIPRLNILQENHYIQNQSGNYVNQENTNSNNSSSSNIHNNNTDNDSSNRQQQQLQQYQQQQQQQQQFKLQFHPIFSGIERIEEDMQENNFEYPYGSSTVSKKTGGPKFIFDNQFSSSSCKNLNYNQQQYPQMDTSISHMNQKYENPTPTNAVRDLQKMAKIQMSADMLSDSSYYDTCNNIDQQQNALKDADEVVINNIPL